MRIAANARQTIPCSGLILRRALRLQIQGEALVSRHVDEFREVGRGYGNAQKPDDFLESFNAFVLDNLDKIAAPKVVVQQPRDLTRRQLRELKLALDMAGFSETNLRTAWQETTNQEMAATMIGYIRNAADGLPLMPFPNRVKRAMDKILRPARVDSCSNRIATSKSGRTTFSNGKRKNKISNAAKPSKPSNSSPTRTGCC